MLKRNKNIKKESVPVAPVKVPTGGKTIIGEGVTIEGTIRARENLVLEGTVKGKIELEHHHLMVGTKGRVEADIYANSITVSGKMVGGIKCKDNIVITKDADFNGEIKAKRISVEDGAFLKAVVELEREPRKKEPEIQSIGEKSAVGGSREPIVPSIKAEKES